VVIVPTRKSRAEQVNATREALLNAAERLFAEHGVHAVAGPRISEAAGQGNNAAVSYHFGTKADVIRAIVRKHTEQIEQGRVRMMEDLDESADLRDWIACMVRPLTEHLESLGNPTWYARFTAQVMADPALHAVMFKESSTLSPSLEHLLEGLRRRVPDLPDEVHNQRGLMARHLMVQMCVERERALAEHSEAYPPTWHDTATGLVDAIVGLWQAPVTHAD
jgi:AcrR family transcriptional regulator